MTESADRLKNRVKIGNGVTGAKVVEFDGNSNDIRSTSSGIRPSKLDGGTANNGTDSATGMQLKLPAGTTAQLAALTRAAGVIAYNTETGKAMVDNGSNFSELGGGAGSLSVIANRSDANTGWAAAGSGITGATTLESANLPLGSAEPSAIALTSTASGTESTDYFGYAFTMPQAFRNSLLSLSAYIMPGSGFAADEWSISLYQGSTRIALPTTDVSNISYLPNGTVHFKAPVFVDDSTSYTLRFSRVAGTGTATLYVAGIELGPGPFLQGAFAGPPTAYSPTIVGAGTTTNNTLQWVRQGGCLYLIGGFTAGTPTATEFQLPLPDSNVIGTGFSAQTLFGYLERDVDSALQKYTLRGISGESYLTVGRIVDAGTGNPLGDPGVNGTSMFSAGNRCTVLAGPIPIAGWENSGSLGQNNVEYAYNTNSSATTNNTTDFGFGADGVLFPSITAYHYKRVRFQTQIQATDQIVLEVYRNGVWTPLSDMTNGGVIPFTYENTTKYGMTTVPVDSQHVDVYFGQYRNKAESTFGAAGNAWSGASTMKWRVKKFSGGHAVGFGSSTATALGLAKKNRWQKKTTGVLGGVTTGIQTPFSMNNLVVGRTYEYTVGFTIEQQSGATDVHAGIDIKNGATKLGDSVLVDIDASVAIDRNHISITRVFTATATTAVMDFVTENNVYIRSGEAILKELNNWESTTDFT